MRRIVVGESFLFNLRFSLVVVKPSSYSHFYALFGCALSITNEANNFYLTTAYLAYSLLLNLALGPSLAGVPAGE
jgi:hypothetical protein